VSRLEQVWGEHGWLSWALWPVSILYRLVIVCRRFAYHRGWAKTHEVSLPVVVVGNITVGGTGKSPLCLFLVRFFQAAGWRPAIVSRGYGGERHLTPHMVAASDTPANAGDEPLMLFQQSGVPVCVCVKRSSAVEHIAAHSNADIVFADDGLQHLAMPRVAEVVVLDGRRGLGNGCLLPAGPLRESASRLGDADVIAVQGTDRLHDSLQTIIESRGANDIEVNRFHLQLTEVIALSDGRRLPLGDFVDKPIIAMAGIGHPDRFFDALRSHGLQITGIAKPDHHQYTFDDFAIQPGLPVFVTAKDAVKLKILAKSQQICPVDIYEVPANVIVSEPLQESIARLESALRTSRGNQSSV